MGENADTVYSVTKSGLLCSFDTKKRALEKYVQLRVSVAVSHWQAKSFARWSGGARWVVGTLSVRSRRVVAQLSGVVSWLSVVNSYRSMSRNVAATWWKVVGPHFFFLFRGKETQRLCGWVPFHSITKLMSYTLCAGHWRKVRNTLKYEGVLREIWTALGTFLGLFVVLRNWLIVRGKLSWKRPIRPLLFPQASKARCIAVSERYIFCGCTDGIIRWGKPLFF